MMTNWLPTLTEANGPLYLRLADQIESDIANRVLQPGAKLPPQRNLAFDIGVTIGTVGRAYALLRQRGLVTGEVGRGTYVRPTDAGALAKSFSAAPTSLEGTRQIFLPPGKLSMDSTSAPNVGQAQTIGAIANQIAEDFPAEVNSYTRNLPRSWQDAGRRWLSIGDWVPDADLIVPTLGGHSAILAVIAATTAPGDKIVFESLTYSSIARSATLLGRQTVTVEFDADGILPEDFERVCAQQHPKLAFLVPTLQNPTLTIMPEERRRAIVAIARKYNVLLLEDAIYAALLDEQPPTLAALAPERTYHIGSLSKTVAAGLRGGWVACPPNLASRVLTATKMLTGGTPFLLAETSARLVLSGEADNFRKLVKAEIQARGSIAREELDGYEFRAHAYAPFIWLKLPEPWLSGTYKNAAASEGVIIDDEDEYKCGRTARAYHRVRIGFSTPRTHDDVRAGFAKLRSLLDNRITGYDSYG